jgi:hypothetical protein
MTGGPGVTKPAAEPALVATARNCPSLLIARPTVLRFLQRSAPEPGGRPPRDPLRRRAAWEPDFSGMVCEIPCRLRYRRMRLLLYALSGRVNLIVLRPSISGVPPLMRRRVLRHQAVGEGLARACALP